MTGEFNNSNNKITVLNNFSLKFGGVFYYSCRESLIIN